MKSKEAFLRNLPYFLQNFLVTIFNCHQYKLRNGGDYKKYKEYYKLVEKMTKEEVEAEVNRKKEEFLDYACKNSEWYKPYYKKNLNEFPILEKADIINNLDKIKTIPEAQGKVSLTGGTTGASMKVIADIQNVQERFAILDNFRESFGYQLGKKTAWFSGKNLISQAQIDKGICSHYDYINKIRFYSTFLINEKNFESYWNSLNEFNPEFLVGFPSSVFEICKIAETRGYKYSGKAHVFFPTAETVLPEHRNIISRVLGCKVVDQYASSEGAPFILECSHGKLHIHPLTGIFEIVDDDLKPADSGEILVTSFTTKGTPLIRYRVGDKITLGNNSDKCECGSFFPIVESIEGRTTDYVYSQEFGKVNLGNISNSTKNIIGIICFQILQYEEDEINLKMVVNPNFSKNDEIQFINALRERLGDKINIILEYVAEIPKEKSGKFRIVKNFLKF